MEAMEGLNKTAQEKFEKIWDINDKKIQLKCGEVQRQLEVGRKYCSVWWHMVELV